ncbi:hypothetical protein BDY21DRAFT_299655 [Lineolata rhizophorae]|uniref:FAS1 domain-containing protein n=1 Tax=Lineolata rhizophorae TaxID=578093 RepID=A0A6A6P7U5_9PEZI|nr:hypothetical protein BDY21DRAFT_299655 [Lineolata rhizophorae]
MKFPGVFLFYFTFYCLALSASARLFSRSFFPVIDLVGSPPPADPQRPLQQAPVDSGIITDTMPTSGGVRISDSIGRNPNINIFSGFTRDIEEVSTRLEDGEKNTTVLAPENAAIMGLPRKPWEDPRDYDALGMNAYEGAEGESRAHKNLRRFTEAHIVPESPWKEGLKMETMAGNTVWIEMKGGKTLIQPSGVEVASVADAVSNGEVWILKGVLNYA